MSGDFISWRAAFLAAVGPCGRSGLRGRCRQLTIGEPALPEKDSYSCLGLIYVSTLTYMSQEKLSTDVQEAIAAVSTQLRLRFQASALGVGFVAMATLRHLVRKGPRTVSELALADQVTTQAISLRVRPLIEAGLATRTPDPADGRRTVLSATPLARRGVQQAEAGAHRALSRAIDRLQPADHVALRSAVPVLLQISQNLVEELP
jgi:DNA-binding MarR family transcriptional regulator